MSYPAGTERGLLPVALYAADGVLRTGYSSANIAIAGRYRVSLVWSVTAAGGGVVRWIVGMSVGGVAAGINLEGRFDSGTMDKSVSGTALGADVRRLTPCGEVYIDGPAVIGMSVARQSGVAPDTCAADAYLVGVFFERIGEL